MKTIVYLITSFIRGGAEAQVAKLAAALSNEIDVHVVSMVGMPGDELEHPELEGKNITIHFLGMQKGKAGLYDLFLAYKLLRLISPDVVHSHMVHANILARLLKPFLCYKLISTAHNVVECQGFMSSIYRYTKRLSNINTQVSQAGLDAYKKEGLFSTEDILLYNGVESTFFVSLDSLPRRGNNRCLKLLCVAKYRPQKNLTGLIDACSLLKNKGINFSLEIAGDGELFDEIDQYRAKSDVANEIKLIGLRSDIRELMKKADAVVLSSHYEGLPMVLIEAAAVGTLIVSTDVGGIAEIVIDGDTGFLVKEGDMVAFADALERTAKVDASSYKYMSCKAIIHAKEKFNLDSVVEHWQKVYASV
ncbi:MAG: glycosyltransferase [Pseudomonadales bacterium]|nr:glycosyltransferase [Pseudomonadales bacterium]